MNRSPRFERVVDLCALDKALVLVIKVTMCIAHAIAAKVAAF
jgi:hypothetical protein